MDNFLTWDILLTYSGCIAGTVLMTEFGKKVLPKFPAQLLSFLIAVLILFVGHWATATLVWTEAPLYLVNAVAVSLAANGGFDALKKIFIGTDTDGDLVVQHVGEESAEVYLSVDSDPSEYKEGEILKFKVMKPSQE